MSPSMVDPSVAQSNVDVINACLSGEDHAEEVAEERWLIEGMSDREAGDLALWNPGRGHWTIFAEWRLAYATDPIFREAFCGPDPAAPLGRGEKL